MLPKQHYRIKSQQKQLHPKKKYTHIATSLSNNCYQLDDLNINKKYAQANTKSCSLMRTGLLKQALFTLQNTHKQIEQNIAKGYKINDLIMNTTLHNLSAVHKKLGNNSKSLQILRSLLYSINNRFMRIQQECNFQVRMLQLNMAINITKYYIYFLALTIQLRMFQAATIPTNRILQFMKKFCKDYRKSELNLALINTRMTNQLLNQIEQFQNIFNSSSFWELMDNLKESVLKIKKIPITAEKSFSKIKKFSLQNIAVLTPIQMNVTQNRITTKYFNNRAFQNGLIQFPVGLFLIGKASYQSICNKYKAKEDTFQKISNLDKPKQYILWSLYFASQLCPYLTPLHKQIFQFYETNFYKVEQQFTNKNIKIVTSLNPPSLKDSNVWKQIKYHFSYLEQAIVNKLQINAKVDKNCPILNEEHFHQILQLQKQKKIHSPKQQIFIIQRKIPAKRRNSEQSFKSEKNLFNKTQAKLLSQPKAKIEKAIKSNKNIFQQKPKEKKKKETLIPKKRFKQNISNSFSLSNQSSKSKNSFSLSNQSSKSKNSFSLSNQSIKSKNIKSKKKTPAKNQNIFLQEYFPKQSQKKLKAAIKTKKQSNKQLISNYLSLEKNMKQATKSLSKKKKDLLKNLKKI